MHPHLARFGPVLIPTFGAVAAAGLVLAIVLAARGARVLRLDEDAVWNLCMATAVGTLVLSRLIIVAEVPRAFLHYPLYILTLPTVTRYGLLAALLSGLGYALIRRLPLLRTADALAPAALLLQGALHLGTLFSGDDIGAPTTSKVGTWIPGSDGFHPVALYAAVFSLLASGIAFFWLTHETQPGEAFGVGLALAAPVRFFVDQFRPTNALPDTMVAHLLRVDQILLIALTVTGLCFLFQRRARHAQ